MPLFFFHIRGVHQELSRDELGLEFPDLKTVYLETFCAARDIAIELTACGRNPRGCTIEVMNAADELVFELPFSEALDHQIHHLLRRFLQ
ncbi:hypothetical protein DC522_29160 [Microvirga sp. KLBC 81]|uniref:DUF6894 family protein n=1 Tax=Microvirga sp. KLBC 81 TaxID=1862707 RepID=UPI000D51E034|nr:hypothetical protein [Microvirga sp. KLBC 81]PVE20993.1 hypothetical protein DC522_29160 [Microvirga sp. KLBC 81]